MLDDDRVLEHLSRAVTFRTVSPQPPEPRDEAAFTAFLDWLEQAYPRVFANLEAERIGGLTLLLSWAGTDSTAAPVLLAGHYDVVPVTPGSDQDWQDELVPEFQVRRHRRGRLPLGAGRARQQERRDRAARSR